MNVLMVVSPDYPDMDTVRERLLAGSKTEHTTFRRANDRTMKGIADVLGIEVEEAISEWDWETSSPAYAEEMLTRMDFVIVYGTHESTVTTPYRQKASTHPYSLIWGAKVELNVTKPKPKKRVKRRRPE